MKRLLAILLAAAVFVTLGAGCAPAKKPLTPRPDPRIVAEPKDSTPRNNTVGMPTNSSEMNKLADKLSKEAVKVPGVKSATVAVSGREAYVGVDLKAEAAGQETTNIKNDVANRVKKSDNRLTNVYVSTDADTVTRIRKVAQGIEQGKPLTSFSAQLSEIGRRIVPKTAK